MKLKYNKAFIKDYPEWNIKKSHEDYQCPDHLCCYMIWLENKVKLKNLGEGEAETGYALLSDVRLLVDSVYCLIKNGVGDCICDDEELELGIHNPDCVRCECKAEINDVLNKLDKVKAHF